MSFWGFDRIPPENSALELCLVVCVGVLIAKIVHSYIAWKLTSLNKIPGPNQSFFSGVFREIRNEPFLEPHKRWWREAGTDVPMLHYSSLLGQHSIVVLDKQIVQTVLSAPSGKDKYPRFRKQSNFLKTRIGDGLVTLEGPDWTRHRRIIQPSFHTGILKDSLGSAIPPLVNRLVQSWKSAPSAEIDVSSHLSALTLDVVGIVLFSHRFHALRGVEDWVKQNTTPFEKSKPRDDGLSDPFVRGLLQSLKINLLSVLLSASGMVFLDPWVNPQLRRSTRIINEAVDEVISNAKREESSKSLLHLLLQAQDEKGEGRKLTHNELRDESKTFLMAGHETTSTWLYWTLYALAKYPDVQDRLAEEISRQSIADDDIGLAEVNNMIYMHAVLQEVLRLYSPVGMLVRFNTYPETFAGYDIPKDTRIVLPMHLLHRHPKYWDDPESFIPERWLDVSDNERERRRFAFFPFSAGGRNCIGQRFASLEAQLILAPLLRSFIIQMAPSQREVTHTFTNTITMKTKPRLKIIVKLR